MCEIFMHDPVFIRRTRVPQGAAVIRLYRWEENGKTGALARCSVRFGNLNDPPLALSRAI